MNNFFNFRKKTETPATIPEPIIPEINNIQESINIPESNNEMDEDYNANFEEFIVNESTVDINQNLKNDIIQCIKNFISYLKSNSKLSNEDANKNFKKAANGIVKKTLKKILQMENISAYDSGVLKSNFDELKKIHNKFSDAVTIYIENCILSSISNHNKSNQYIEPPQNFNSNMNTLRNSIGSKLSMFKRGGNNVNAILSNEDIRKNIEIKSTLEDILKIDDFTQLETQSSYMGGKKHKRKTKRRKYYKKSKYSRRRKSPSRRRRK